MTWGAAIATGVYSSTRVYVLGLTFASEAEARAAAAALVDKITTIIQRSVEADTDKAEWAAGAEIDALLGEESNVYCYSSYSDKKDWRVDVAELTERPWRIR